MGNTKKHEYYEELLIIRCKQNQKEALNELIDLWQDRLFYYIRRLVKTEEDAWDVLQEVWLKVIKGINSLREPRKLSVWLYRISYNVTKSYWEKKYRTHLPIDNDINIIEIENMDNSLNFLENADEIHRGLNNISLKSRQILTLFFLEEFSIEQISQVLDLPSGTVKSRLYYAKHEFMKILN